MARAGLSLFEKGRTFARALMASRSEARQAHGTSTRGPYVQTSTTLVSLTTPLRIKLPSGGFMPQGLGGKAFLSTLIIWERTAKTRRSIAVRPQNFATVWQRDSRGRSPPRNPGGILMMRLYGNLGASA